MSEETTKRDDDLRDAMRFFAERLRNVKTKDADETEEEATEATDTEATKATEANLLRWTRRKLRNDAQAVAELMLAVGYRPTFIRYFLRYHIPTINETAAIGETYIDPGAADAHLGLCWRFDDAVVIVVADLHDAAKRLRQPYRDLAAVCLRWGYVHETVVQLLAKVLERKA